MDGWLDRWKERWIDARAPLLFFFIANHLELRQTALTMLVLCPLAAPIVIILLVN